MNRTGQVLLETLVAAIFLVILIPNIPALCWEYAGPDPTKYKEMVAQNNARILMIEFNAKAAALRTQLNTLEAERLKDKAKQQKQLHDVMAAETERQHRQAMNLFAAFSDRQANVFAKCMTKVGGKLNQSQKDHMIFGIWSRTDDSCDQITGEPFQFASS